MQVKIILHDGHEFECPEESLTLQKRINGTKIKRIIFPEDEETEAPKAQVKPKK